VFGSAIAAVDGGVHVVAHAHAIVTAHGRAAVEAHGRVVVSAYDDAVVDFGPNVTLREHGTRAHRGRALRE
jgi:hypothetical protein